MTYKADRWDYKTLRQQLHDLDDHEIGVFLGLVLGVIASRGIDLESFLPKLTDTVLDDDEIVTGLRKLGGS